MVSRYRSCRYRQECAARKITVSGARFPDFSGWPGETKPSPRRSKPAKGELTHENEAIEPLFDRPRVGAGGLQFFPVTRAPDVGDVRVATARDAATPAEGWHRRG